MPGRRRWPGWDYFCPSWWWSMLLPCWQVPAARPGRRLPWVRKTWKAPGRYWETVLAYLWSLPLGWQRCFMSLHPGCFGCLAQAMWHCPMPCPMRASISWESFSWWSWWEWIPLLPPRALRNSAWSPQWWALCAILFWIRFWSSV